jgi:hypothetical protein
MDQRTADAPVKRIPATDAAGLVRPGMWLDLGGSCSHPDFREGLERDAYEHRLIPRWGASSR